MKAITETDLVKFVTQRIAEIAPSVYPEVRWTPTEGTPGTVRQFYVSVDAPQLVKRGMMAGSVFEHRAKLHVHTYYTQDYMRSAWVEDQSQIANALNDAREAGVLWNVSTFSQHVTRRLAEGAAHVEHVFCVHYMRSIST